MPAGGLHLDRETRAAHSAKECAPHADQEQIDGSNR